MESFYIDAVNENPSLFAHMFSFYMKNGGIWCRVFPIRYTCIILYIGQNVVFFSYCCVKCFILTSNFTDVFVR